MATLFTSPIFFFRSRLLYSPLFVERMREKNPRRHGFGRSPCRRLCEHKGKEWARFPKYQASCGCRADWSSQRNRLTRKCYDFVADVTHLVTHIALTGEIGQHPPQALETARNEGFHLELWMTDLSRNSFVFPRRTRCICETLDFPIAFRKRPATEPIPDPRTPTKGAVRSKRWPGAALLPTSAGITRI